MMTISIYHRQWYDIRKDFRNYQMWNDYALGVFTEELMKHTHIPLKVLLLLFLNNIILVE